jgi:hypothetical protein
MVRVLVLVPALAAALSCARGGERAVGRTFATPEEAVTSLAAAVKAGQLDEVRAIFGPDSQELIDSSDAVTARRNQQVFSVAMAEGWRLVEHGADSRTLVVGGEEWPFPVPLVRDDRGWHFDTAAGKEEVLARRIGRNELAAIRICRTYVAAQRVYARTGHDGKPPGLYARAFRSDPGRQNGLYWPVEVHRKRSPLGDLVARAAAEGQSVVKGDSQPAPFHGYYFKVLTAQGRSARGGARDYVVNGDLSGGFALVAWPAQYDATGVMTFIVNHEGVIHEKDLGAGTDAAARAMTSFDPDPSWAAVQ